MTIDHPNMARLRVLAIAVATGRVGYAFVSGDRLKDWRMSKKASMSPQEARKLVKQWISFFKPDVVVTEKIGKHSRKGSHTKRITAAIAKVAEHADLLNVLAPRIQAFKNKYEEARMLAKRFPELQDQVPREPRIWQSEPFSTIYFEALALALVVIDSPEPYKA